MILLDVRMPGVDGISALPYLVPIAPVLMLTYSGEPEIVQEALRRGADGYLVHGEFTADQLASAVRDTVQGRTHLTPTAAGALLTHLRDANAHVNSHVPPPQGDFPSKGFRNCNHLWDSRHRTGRVSNSARGRRRSWTSSHPA